MGNRIRRRAALALPLGIPFALPSLARAQAAWPDRPIRFVVPFSAGGGTDLLARALAQPLAALLGQPFVVENRPGAAGSVGSELVARAGPGAPMILMGHVGTLAVNPSLYALGYDPLTGLAPVSLVAVVPNLLVANPAVLPVEDVAGLVAAARARPGLLTYGSSGNGSISHTAMAAFAHAAGVSLTQVPYRGTGPLVADLIAGQVQMTASGITTLLPHVREGRLRALAVFTEARLPQHPAIPAATETLPGFTVAQWQGVAAPGGTDPAIVARLNAAIATALRTPEVEARLAKEGAIPSPGTPAEFAALIRAEITRWAAVVKAADLRAE